MAPPPSYFAHYDLLTCLLPSHLWTAREPAAQRPTTKHKKERKWRRHSPSLPHTCLEFGWARGLGSQQRNARHCRQSCRHQLEPALLFLCFSLLHERLCRQAGRVQRMSAKPHGWLKGSPEATRGWTAEHLAPAPSSLTQRCLHAGAQAARILLVPGQPPLRGGYRDRPLVLAACPLPQLLSAGGRRKHVLVALQGGGGGDGRNRLNSI